MVIVRERLCAKGMKERPGITSSLTERYLLSPSLHRLTRIISHLLPNDPSIVHSDFAAFSGDDGETKPLQIFTELYFRNLFCFEFAGNVHHLTIENANTYIDDFTEEENGSLRRSLLNTNNDVCRFTQVLHQLALAHGIHDLRCEIYGHICANNLVERIDRFHSMTHGDHTHSNVGTVCYYSGHGRSASHVVCDQNVTSKDTSLVLSLARNVFDHKSEELVSVNAVLSRLRSKGPVLLILECCHSGAAVLGNMGSFDENNPYVNVFILSSCSADELSGAWIMDGMDSGAIMTKVLTDPIGTYFKIAYQVFYDFGGSWLTTSKNNQRTLYELYDQYSDMIIDEWRSNYPNSLHVKAFNWLREHAPHIFILFKNFLLLVRYGHKLHMPQAAVSFPDLSATKNSHHWTAFEQVMENSILQLWDDRCKSIPE